QVCSRMPGQIDYRTSDRLGSKCPNPLSRDTDVSQVRLVSKLRDTILQLRDGIDDERKIQRRILPSRRSVADRALSAPKLNRFDQYAFMVPAKTLAGELNNDVPVRGPAPQLRGTAIRAFGGKQNHRKSIRGSRVEDVNV